MWHKKSLSRGAPEEHDESDAESNCDLPHLRMTWHFGDRTWYGDFVSGPMRGSSFTCSVGKMTAEKWASVRTAVTAVAVDFERATLPQLKEGTRLLLQRHCEAELRKHDPGNAV